MRQAEMFSFCGGGHVGLAKALCGQSLRRETMREGLVLLSNVRTMHSYRCCTGPSAQNHKDSRHGFAVFGKEGLVRDIRLLFANPLGPPRRFRWRPEPQQLEAHIRANQSKTLDVRFGAALFYGLLSITGLRPSYGSMKIGSARSSTKL